MTSQEIIIYGGAALLVYLYYKFKHKIGQELIVAFLMSLAWVSVSGIYGYRDSNTTLFGINMFPLVAWTAGLVLLREIYERLPKQQDRFLNATLIYLVLITTLEYVGYNYWGIQLQSHYAGLGGFELMHMPWGGQLYYLAAGPIYLKITDYLKVK